MEAAFFFGFLEASHAMEAPVPSKSPILLALAWLNYMSKSPFGKGEPNAPVKVSQVLW